MSETQKHRRIPSNTPALKMEGSQSMVSSKRGRSSPASSDTAAGKEESKESSFPNTDAVMGTTRRSTRNDSITSRVSWHSHKSATYSSQRHDTFEGGSRKSIDEDIGGIPSFEPRNSRRASGQKRQKALSRRSAEASTWTKNYTPVMISKQQGGWDELVNLEQLHNLKMISGNEYNERKRKLVDNLTGTYINEPTKLLYEARISKAAARGPKRILGEIEIRQDYPEWDTIKPERAIRHTCTIVNNKEEWTQTMRTVKMATNPFDNGTLRYVYYMSDITELEACQQKNITAAHTFANPAPASHVAKVAIDPMEERESYFIDVAMQMHAQRFADMFNLNEVPKKIGFLECWVYELVDRTPHIYCGVEKYIEGDYNKYTNNWDWTNDTIERNTPQAFSHYTYEASEHKILICDIQGVNDLYTDPQMHTHDGQGCGKGNMGQKGIAKFLSSHKCNAICHFLKLPKINPKSEVAGTLPTRRYINKSTIDTLPGISTQYTIPDGTDPTTALLHDKTDGSMGGSLFPKLLEDDKESSSCWCFKCCCL